MKKIFLLNVFVFSFFWQCTAQKTSSASNAQTVYNDYCTYNSELEKLGYDIFLITQSSMLDIYPQEKNKEKIQEIKKLFSTLITDAKDEAVKLCLSVSQETLSPSQMNSLLANLNKISPKFKENIKKGYSELIPKLKELSKVAADQYKKPNEPLEKDANMNDWILKDIKEQEESTEKFEKLSATVKTLQSTLKTQSEAWNEMYKDAHKTSKEKEMFQLMKTKSAKVGQDFIKKIQEIKKLVKELI